MTEIKHAVVSMDTMMQKQTLIIRFGGEKAFKISFDISEGRAALDFASDLANLASDIVTAIE